MKNPFPEKGDIKEITMSSDYDVFSMAKNLKDDFFRWAVCPDNYILNIKYENYECKYQCFNLTEEQYIEIKNGLLNNSEFILNKEGWPTKLVWKDFHFYLISCEEVLYKS